MSDVSFADDLGIATSNSISKILRAYAGLQKINPNHNLLDFITIDKDGKGFDFVDEQKYLDEFNPRENVVMGRDFFYHSRKRKYRWRFQVHREYAEALKSAVFGLKT